MKRVVLESPLAGDFQKNIIYARICMKDCLQRNEAPYASHLLYPQCLDDENLEQREQGIKAGFIWAEVCDTRVFYVDLGWSSGMKRGKEEAQRLNQTVIIRQLPAELLVQFQKIITEKEKSILGTKFASE